MNLLGIFCFLLWMYLLSVLKRGRLDFWYFLIGSVGLFLFMLAYIEPFFISYLTKGVAAVSGIWGEFTGVFDSYFEYGILFVKNNDSVISLYIDYECSGIIEIMAFLSMLWFFHVYHFYEKLILSIAGVLWIFSSNIIRIYAICILIYLFGNEVFYFAHTIFGRIIFYGLSITLYFHVFTHSQILRQKVGNYNYDMD